MRTITEDLHSLKKNGVILSFIADEALKDRLKIALQNTELGLPGGLKKMVVHVDTDGGITLKDWK